jgi:outer membrane protein assembly factor BamB
MSDRTITTNDLLFVGFNGRVIALDRADGSVVWKWKPSQKGMGNGMVTLLPDGERLFATIMGYTWAIDPVDGRELWYQPLKGEGQGIPTLATMVSSSDGARLAATAAAAQASAAQMAH